MKPIEIYFDGCCQPVNPGGHGGAGYMISTGKETIKNSIYLGCGELMNCNVAEYRALILSLHDTLAFGLQDEQIVASGDSQLVIMQMKGEWRAKGGIYYPHYIEARNLAKKFKNLTFSWIPREENYEADYLSKIGSKKDLPQDAPHHKAIPTVTRNISKKINSCTEASCKNEEIFRNTSCNA